MPSFFIINMVFTDVQLVLLSVNYTSYEMFVSMVLVLCPTLLV